ncbi:MAG: hypothetical protein ABFS24_13740, partial [Pseudomonadota bacterium]
VPGWGARPASEITRTDVINLIEDVSKRGDRVAGLLLAVARKDEITGNPWARLRGFTPLPRTVECSKEGKLTPATQVDHVVPHDGDTRLMFSSSNFQSLCASRHSAAPARENMKR